MQTTRRAVRYYIDRDADTPVIRSVPVTRLSSADASELPAAGRLDGQAESATTSYNASADRRRTARRRLAEMVQSTVRRHRNHNS